MFVSQHMYVCILKNHFANFFCKIRSEYPHFLEIFLTWFAATLAKGTSIKVKRLSNFTLWFKDMIALWPNFGSGLGSQLPDQIWLMNSQADFNPAMFPPAKTEGLWTALKCVISAPFSPTSWTTRKFLRKKFPKVYACIFKLFFYLNVTRRNKDRPSTINPLSTRNLWNFVGFPRGLNMQKMIKCQYLCHLVNITSIYFISHVRIVNDF